MMNRKALGRGLSALLPDVPAESQSEGSIQFVRVDRITPNPFQPRETFDPQKLEELTRSIAEKGVVQPITVRRFQDDFQLIAGERRLRCVRDLGVEKIPAYIIDVDSDEEMMELAIIENIHREDLNPIDIANGYRRLIEECRLTQEQVAQKVGKDRATVTNFLRLLRLPRRIQESTQNGEISMGHARALLSLENAEQQLDLWKKIVKSSFSVRQVEEAVRKLNEPPSDKKPEPATHTAYFDDAENRLRTKLATKVTIKRRANGGAIEIEYYNDDDLERIIHGLVDGF